MRAERQIDGSWLASGRVTNRPCLAEGNSREEAVDGFMTIAQRILAPVKTVPATAGGHPCLARVDVCEIHPGDPSCRDSDLDFYGYTEVEFTLLTLEGEEAPWLEVILAPAEREAIRMSILETHEFPDYGY